MDIQKFVEIIYDQMENKIQLQNLRIDDLEEELYGALEKLQEIQDFLFNKYSNL